MIFLFTLFMGSCVALHVRWKNYGFAALCFMLWLGALLGFMIKT